MIFENLDVILIAAAGILIAVSIVLNVVSSARLGRLTETLNQLEAKFESFHPRAAGDSKNDSRHGSSAIKLDSSVFPSQEFSPGDSRMGTRYRPPGSRSKKTGDGETPETGPVSIPPTRRIKISKSGVKIPEGADSAEPAPELPGAQTRAGQPEEGRESAAAAAESPPPPDAEEDKALLKAYLGREPAAAGKPSDDSSGLADIREIYGDKTGDRDNGGAPEEPDDIMDVVEDSGVFDKPDPDPDSDTPRKS